MPAITLMKSQLAYPTRNTKNGFLTSTVRWLQKGSSTSLGWKTMCRGYTIETGESTEEYAAYAPSFHTQGQCGQNKESVLSHESVTSHLVLNTVPQYKGTNRL